MDIFQQATDNNGDFVTPVNRDAFLTDVTLYWVTDTVGSSIRIYREFRLSGGEAKPQPILTVPIAFADFPKECLPVLWAGPNRPTTLCNIPKCREVATLPR
jgi:hypothetical protein